MVEFLTSFYVIIVLIAVALGGYAIYLHIKKDEVPLDYSIVYNYLSSYTGGHFEGVIVDEIKGKKRDGIIFVPRDVNFMKLSRDKKDINKIPKQIVWFDKNKRKDFPRGTLSAYRNIVIIQPKNSEDYPEYFKNTELGKSMINLTEEKNNEKTIVDTLRIKSDNLKRISRELGAGEPLGLDFFELLQSKQQDSLDALAKEKEKSKTSGIGEYHEPK